MANKPTLPVTPKRKRSRFGCHNCKQNKVKCDEVKPSCGLCVTKGRKCDYSLKLSWGGRSVKNNYGFPPNIFNQYTNPKTPPSKISSSSINTIITPPSTSIAPQNNSNCSHTSCSSNLLSSTSSTSSSSSSSPVSINANNKSSPGLNIIIPPLYTFANDAKKEYPSIKINNIKSCHLDNTDFEGQFNDNENQFSFNVPSNKTPHSCPDLRITVPPLNSSESNFCNNGNEIKSNSACDYSNTKNYNSNYLNHNNHNQTGHTHTGHDFSTHNLENHNLSNHNQKDYYYNNLNNFNPNDGNNALLSLLAPPPSASVISTMIQPSSPLLAPEFSLKDPCPSAPPFSNSNYNKSFNNENNMHLSFTQDDTNCSKCNCKKTVNKNFGESNYFDANNFNSLKNSNCYSNNNNSYNKCGSDIFNSFNFEVSSIKNDSINNSNVNNNNQYNGCHSGSKNVSCNGSPSFSNNFQYKIPASDENHYKYNKCFSQNNSTYKYDKCLPSNSKNLDLSFQEINPNDELYNLFTNLETSFKDQEVNCSEKNNIDRNIDINNTINNTTNSSEHTQNNQFMSFEMASQNSNTSLSEPFDENIFNVGLDLFNTFKECPSVSEENGFLNYFDDSSENLDASFSLNEVFDPLQYTVDVSSSKAGF